MKEAIVMEQDTQTQVQDPHRSIHSETGARSGEHPGRSGNPLVKAAGFQIVETERLKTGTVERVHAVRPAEVPAR